MVNLADPFNLAGVQDSATRNILTQGAVNRIDQRIPGANIQYSGPGRTSSAITLDPAIQALFEKRVGAANTGAGAAQGLLTGLEGGRAAVTQSFYDKQLGLLNPTFDQNESRLKSTLLNRGIPEGGEAYTNAYNLEIRNPRNKAYTTAAQNAVLAGGTDMLNTTNVAKGLIGIDPTTGIPGNNSFTAPATVDVQGAEQLKFNAALAENNAAQAADRIDAALKAGNLEALTSLGAAGITALLTAAPASVAGKLATSIAEAASAAGTGVKNFVYNTFGIGTPGAQELAAQVEALGGTAGQDFVGAGYDGFQGFGDQFTPGNQLVPDGQGGFMQSTPPGLTDQSPDIINASFSPSTSLPGYDLPAVGPDVVDFSGVTAQQAISMGIPASTVETLGPELAAELHSAEVSMGGFDNEVISPLVTSGAASAAQMAYIAGNAATAAEGAALASSMGLAEMAGVMATLGPAIPLVLAVYAISEMYKANQMHTTSQPWQDFRGVETDSAGLGQYASPDAIAAFQGIQAGGAKTELDAQGAGWEYKDSILNEVGANSLQEAQVNESLGITTTRDESPMEKATKMIAARGLPYGTGLSRLAEAIRVGRGVVSTLDQIVGDYNDGGGD